MTDRDYMKLALELAGTALGRTSPNPMVGAVVVKDGEIVGEGFHARAGSPHAEVVALQNAGERSAGATLYVTLEPCCHYGRTGPCTLEVLQSGVKRVVMAMADPNPAVAGKGMALLKKAGIEVECGVLEDEARNLNEVFIKYISNRLPFVVMKAAMSLDGKIATHTGESRWITGPEAREKAHRLRDQYDAILVGINTVLADNPSLTTRHIPGGRDPIRLVLDSMARTPLESAIIHQDSEAPTIIVTTEKAPLERIRLLKEAGAEVMVVPGLTEEGGRVDIKAMMHLIAAREISSVLIEGGGQIHASALASGVVDKVAWFIAPKLIGGESAPGPLAGTGVQRICEAVSLERVSVSKLGNDIFVEGYISKQ